jgi:hypothetical protein
MVVTEPSSTLGTLWRSLSIHLSSADRANLNHSLYGIRPDIYNEGTHFNVSHLIMLYILLQLAECPTSYPDSLV